MAIAQFTETTRVRIFDGVANQLRLQLQQYLNQYNDNTSVVRENNEQEREEEEISLLSNYRRMVAFTALV
jgi:hypothetical protein